MHVGEGGGVTASDSGPADGVACPHCDSTDTEVLSLFGTGEMTMQYSCLECHAVFERVKWG